MEESGKCKAIRHHYCVGCAALAGCRMALVPGELSLFTRFPRQTIEIVMSIRITSQSDSCGTVLYIAGKLRGEDVGELEREIGGASSPLVLDVSELSSADTAGANALVALHRGGTQLRGMSPYLELLLK